MAEVNHQGLAAENPQLIRTTLTAFGSKAAQLYQTVKVLHPKVKANADLLEAYMQPYVVRTEEEWNQRGEPVISLLDEKVQRTGTYLHQKVAATEDFVQEQVFKPCHEKLVAPSEVYLEGLKRNAKTVVDESKFRASDTLNTLLYRTNEVVDRVLPAGEEHVDTTADDKDTSALVNVTFLTKKVASRLRSRAVGVYQCNTERVQRVQRVHIDLIEYARATFDKHEEQVAQIFDLVIGALPQAETAKQTEDSLVKRSPKTFKPYVARGASYIPSVLEFTRSKLVFARSYLVKQSIPSSPRLAPTTNETDDSPLLLTDKHDAAQSSVEPAATVITTPTVEEDTTPYVSPALPPASSPTTLAATHPENLPSLEDITEEPASNDSNRTVKKRHSKRRNNNADGVSQQQHA